MWSTSSKKSWLRKSRLYLVLDTDVNRHEDLLKISSVAARAGADIVQLRDKRSDAAMIVQLARHIRRDLKGRVPLIINDRVDVALESGADGVHLGQSDVLPSTARKILGASAIIGRSCQTLAHVRAAAEEKVDYIGFGSVFKTLTKPDRQPMDLKLLQRVLKVCPVPVFAIGGISVGNVKILHDIGVTRVAVTRAVSCAKNISQAVRDLRFQLEVL